MKTINFKQYLWVAIFALSFTSCYNDKGNYDYSVLNEVYVDNTNQKTAFTIEQYDNLQITPNICFTESDISDSDLEYKWVIYSNAWSKDECDEIEISNQRNLDVQISQPANATDYAVKLYIKKKDDNTVYTTKYTVNVQPSVTSGILLVHDDVDGVDADYIVSKYSMLKDNSKQISNVCKLATGKKLSGNAVSVSSVRINYITTVNRVYVATDQELVQLSGYDFGYEANTDGLFYTKPSALMPYSIKREGATPYCTIMMNGDKVYNINNQASQYWSYIFSEPLKPTSSLGEVSLFKDFYIPDENMCIASAIFYDTKGKRFVRIAKNFDENADIISFAPQTSTAFDVNNIGKDIVYFGKGYNSHGYALMSDATLYRANFNMPATIYDEGTHLYNPNPELVNLAVRKYDLSALAEISNAKYYDMGRFANTMMYATERDIYAVTMTSSSVRATKINQEFPSDENITGIMIYNVNTNIQSSLSEQSGKYLYVTTWNGSETKLYEFSIARNSLTMNNDIPDESGVVNAKAPLQTWTIAGKVINMCMKFEGKDDFN